MLCKAKGSIDMDLAIRFHCRIVQTQTKVLPHSIAHANIDQKREKLIGSALFSYTFLELRALATSFFND
jgi:hypothetical protein